VLLSIDSSERFEHAPNEFERIYSNSTEDGFSYVRRGDIPGIITGETVVTAWNEWQRWKRFGLPHGQGWINERPQWIKAVEICEQEFQLWQAREMEEARNANSR
jgi:hypothetical protein